MTDHLNAKFKGEMCKRLARIEGQLRGVQKLVDQDADCEKVIQQMTAARKALDKAFYEMLACVIEHRVLPPNTSSKSSGNREAAITMREVRDLLAKYA